VTPVAAGPPLLKRGLTPPRPLCGYRTFSILANAESLDRAHGAFALPPREREGGSTLRPPPSSLELGPDRAHSESGRGWRRPSGFGATPQRKGAASRGGVLPLHFAGHRPSGRQPRGRARLPIRRSVKNALGRVSPGRAAPVHTEERRVIGGHPRKPCRARRERGARRALPGRGGEPTRAERGKGVPADRAVSPLSAPRSSANKYEVSAICGFFSRHNPKELRVDQAGGGIAELLDTTQAGYQESSARCQRGAALPRILCLA